MTLDQILAEFRNESTSESEKGTKFERLTKFYLIFDPIWSEQFTNVLLREEAGIGPDVGIDLIADDIASGGKVAIQCKFYDEKTYLDDLGTFYTASGKDGFVKRMIVATSNNWTRNADESVNNQQIPVQRVLLHDMQQSLIDWSKFNLLENYGTVPIVKKELRPHQIEAFDSVIDGLSHADRGKMIMACGTGKTLVSLRISEEFLSKKKTPSTVLFLAPSISLLSQTIMEWGQNKKTDYLALAVCSDSKVGKKDDEDMHISDLAIPASTDVTKLVETAGKRGKRDIVIFSTYQSLEIISKAQKDPKNPLPEFDLVVCDEAHRTTGVTKAVKAEMDEYSHFVRIHDNEYVAANKRLYMTATPKIFKDLDGKAAESGDVIASMDDVDTFGEELYRLGFGKAVEMDLLSDYRVLILAVDEEYVAKSDLKKFQSEDATINLDEASKLLGCWRALSKIKTDGDDVDDVPMHRAVAFANTINASEVLAKRLEIVGRTATRPIESNRGLLIEARHVDGKQNALVRRNSLEWLKAKSDINTARVLTNARCLSEGIDVPALDAVIFTEARGSQVDIVQAVGRVMRKFEDKTTGFTKKTGYIILPVAITAGADIGATLKGTKYKVIWDVLNALRAHDDRFDIIINQINLNEKRDNKIDVEVVTDGGDVPSPEEVQEGILVHLPTQIADGVYAKIVEKVGDRKYWERWAKDVASIVSSYQTRILELVSSHDETVSKVFERFLKNLRKTLNPNISREDAIEMLAQHLVTEPIFDALFVNYEFSKLNPVSKQMDQMIRELSKSDLESERSSLEKFYESVHERIKGITTTAAKQTLIKELYDNFFKGAFKVTADKLGIVYTPIEVVDYMINAVESVLNKSFELSVSDPGVHILDPFTGTGTFITRLLQSGLISPENAENKFRYELHANEIVLLAYYVAAVNIEETFHGEFGGEYIPFPGLVLTDTFQMTEGQKIKRFDSDGLSVVNSDRAKEQNEVDIRVIISNPPYSVGQEREGDGDMNDSYEDLDSRIDATYRKKSNAKLTKSLNDSYIRAFRWASDRIGNEGIICFVTGGGWLIGNAMDGMRRCLLEEFSEVYVLDLRGNARTTQGERRSREGEGIFGQGSRTSTTITLLVKKNDSSPGKVFYHDIGDSLKRSQKLKMLQDFSDHDPVWTEIIPNEFADWINQRRSDYSHFPPMSDPDSKGSESASIFTNSCHGLNTSRDAWAYSFSFDLLTGSMKKLIETYELARAERGKSKKTTVPQGPDRIKWDNTLSRKLERDMPAKFEKNKITKSLYRPFVSQFCYFDPMFNARVAHLPSYYPENMDHPRSIVVSGIGSSSGFSCLMVDQIPNLHTLDSDQVFPEFWYEESLQNTGMLESLPSELVRREGVSNWAVNTFSDAIGAKVKREDIFMYTYSVLHSLQFREAFEDNLVKERPRVPLPANKKFFDSFVKAGEMLSKLHLEYENIDPYPLEVIYSQQNIDPKALYKIKKMSFPRGKAVKDRPSSIIYNEYITISGIPDETWDYMLSGKAALYWVMDRFQVSFDKDSGIENNPNDFSENPRYILDLIGQVVAVSIKTLEIVRELPELSFD